MSRLSGLNRRRFLTGAGGLAVAGIAAGCAASKGVRSSTQARATRARATTKRVPTVALGEQPAGLPARQYAWEQYLARDQYGNAVAPRFDRLLMFDVKGTPTAAYRDLLEASLRRLERSYRWGHDGLLFVAAWGHGYFTSTLGTEAPIPLAEKLSSFETPVIEDYDLCLHLACDDEQRLRAVARELVTELRTILVLRDTRSGFVGAGLPYRRQQVSGIPAGKPVPKDSPLYMGFKSALEKNQASEDSVAIGEGPFAHGTTMHVSYMSLTLDEWYRSYDESERVAMMYSPQTTVAASKRFTTDAESNPGQIDAAISKGVIGHAQSSATARRNGKPIILRRDFDTTDGGSAGLHFVCLQQTIEDFVKTRTAMNQANAPIRNPAISDTANNGINAFIIVTKRENFIVPSRAERSFPLLAAE